MTICVVHGELKEDSVHVSNGVRICVFCHEPLYAEKHVVPIEPSDVSASKMDNAVSAFAVAVDAKPEEKPEQRGEKQYTLTDDAPRYVRGESGYWVPKELRADFVSRKAGEQELPEDIFERLFSVTETDDGWSAISLRTQKEV